MQQLHDDDDDDDGIYVYIYVRTHVCLHYCPTFGISISRIKAKAPLLPRGAIFLFYARRAHRFSSKCRLESEDDSDAPPTVYI